MLATKTRTETVQGLVWLTKGYVASEMFSHTDGDYVLEVERYSIIGRLGWQIVRETQPIP